MIEEHLQQGKGCSVDAKPRNEAHLRSPSPQRPPDRCFCFFFFISTLQFLGQLSIEPKPAVHSVMRVRIATASAETLDQAVPPAKATQPR